MQADRNSSIRVFFMHTCIRSCTTHTAKSSPAQRYVFDHLMSEKSHRKSAVTYSFRPDTGSNAEICRILYGGLLWARMVRYCMNLQGLVSYETLS